MTAWGIAAVALVPALTIPALSALRGGVAGRLAAAQLAVAVATPMLGLLCFDFDQSSFADLALALPLLTLPGTFTLALFLERWL